MPLTIETHEAGLRIAAKYEFHIYDALIVASALEAECTTLYSEDLQDGQVIDGSGYLGPCHTDDTNHLEGRVKGEWTIRGAP